MGVLGREGLRALAQEKREKERANRGGMQLDDDGVALDDLGDEQAALIRAMDGVKAKGGSMFAASQQMNNPDGLMFTGTAVRAVAARVAASTLRSSKSRWRTRSCGVSRKPRRPAGARRPAKARRAAAAAAVAEGAYPGRLSLQS